MAVSDAKKQSNSVYYNIDVYNDNTTGGDISSKYSTSFNSPLLMDTSNYEVAVARARIPLDQIPLSQDNIPFEKWQIEIGVPTTGSPANTYTYYNSYVPQFNPITQTIAAFQIGINGQNVYTTSLPENEPTTNPTLTLTAKSPALPLPVSFQLGGNIGVSNTVFGLSYTAYCDANLHTISRYVTATGAFQDEVDVRTKFSFPSGIVNGVCMPPNSNTVYAIVFNGLQDHYLCDVFNPVISVRSINVEGQQLDLLSLSCCSGFLSFTYYANSNNFVQNWTLVEETPSFLNLHTEAAYTATFFDSNLNFFIGLIDSDTVYMRNPVNYDLIQTYRLPGSSFLDRFLGSDIYGNLLISAHNGLSNYKILAYGKQTAILRYSIAMGSNRTLVTSNMIMGAGNNIINPAPYAVQTINDYIRQINLAFAAIMAQIPSPLSSPQLTPFLEFNSATSIIGIVADAGCWSGTNPAGANPACVINFNQLLWSFFKFNSIQALYTALPAVGGVVRTIEINKTIAPAVTSTTTQPNSTLYRFADLTRIIIGTSRMGVFGDSQNNDKLLINIGDFTVDTENGIPNLIIYNPFILRFYKLYQQSPLTSIDTFISYANRAGEVFPINISPYNSIGLKLEFHRIPMV